MSLRKILSHNINYYRKVNRLTQEKLAELMDVSFQSVSKWERGLSLPKTEKLPKLAKTLCCSIDDLFDENSNNNEQKSLGE